MSRHEEVSHHATTTSQSHIPICPLCPWLGHDSEGRYYTAHALQSTAQQALLDHIRKQHGGIEPRHPVPDGWESGSWDPARMYGLTVPRDLHGLLVIAGDTVRTLADDASPGVLDPLTPVERAVLATRLRCWADTLTAPQETP